ncbi:gamma-glutamyltranspeptidase [Wallemia mellicola]|nr:gamma-glutamyltranspeptidase [Wallemia mellicola]TIC57946.1 gamma-glutamyltranspeptidase [Wallemia mellicola]
MKGLSNLEAGENRNITRKRNSSFILAAIALSFLCFGYTTVRTLTKRDWPEHRYTPVLVKGKHGAVATETETCSQMGVDVLKNGGNAADAAVTSTLCIGVMNMFSSGIGGGGFLLHRTPEGDISSIDFRETAPGLADPYMFYEHPHSAQIGGLAVGTPGELAGLHALHEQYGSLEWKDLVLPAAELAKGWPVPKELARRIEISRDWILKDPIWKEWLAPHGTTLKEGDWIARPAYASTLETIAEQGVSAFYEGEIGESFVRTARDASGILTVDDLHHYKVVYGKGYNTSVNGLDVHTCGFPTSGPVMLFMLNALESLDMVPPRKTADDLHKFIETMKFGFAERTRIGDVPFMNDTTAMLNMLNKSYAQETVDKITDRTHTWEYYGPDFEGKDTHGTTHLILVDDDDGVVTLTSTVNGLFGSHVLDEHTGIILNNEMDDFSIPGHPNMFGLWPSPYNLPEPYKRPLSSTAPTIVEREGNLVAALGGSGGSRIFGSVLQTLLHILQGYNPSAAIEAPRVHDQLFPPVVTFESGFSRHLIREMRLRGHNTTVFDFNLGAADVQAVTIEDNFKYAASDSRKGGVAAAY